MRRARRFRVVHSVLLASFLFFFDVGEPSDNANEKELFSKCEAPNEGSLASDTCGDTKGAAKLEKPSVSKLQPTDGAELDADVFISKADAAYADANFPQAVDFYTKAILTDAKSNRVNGHLLYNLGNAYYRRGNFGRAALAYRQALILLPNDRDLKANVTTVSSKLRLDTDAVLRKPPTFFFWLEYFSYRQLIYILVVCYLLFFGGVICLLLKEDRMNRIWVQCFGVGLAILFSSFVFQTNFLRKSEGVIVSQEASLRSGRGQNFVAVAGIDQGASVKLLSTEGDWVKVEVPDADGLRGWIETNNVRPVGAWDLVRGNNLTSLFSRNYLDDSIDTDS